MTKNKTKGAYKILRYTIFITLLIVFAGAIVGFHFYNRIFDANVQIPAGNEYLYIPSNAGFETVLDSLIKNNYLEDKSSFVWVAKQKNYPANVKAGRYELKNGMSNNQLVNILRAGRQSPVNVTFNNIRTAEQLAGRVAGQIEADSATIASLLNDKSFTAKFGFNPATIPAMFIPNTYQFYWDTKAEKFIIRMADEYKKFWGAENRKEKAEKMGLSQLEVSILASIVQAEQARHNDEKPRVAGLYINRLEKGMPLQSDPTLVFALGDFSIRRVLNKDKEINSPFNTYKYAGLPPAPINLPEISSIDAVLNYENHNYLFMCAKEDFSGYHYFSKTNAQHNIYARRYQRALNKRKIMR